MIIFLVIMKFFDLRFLTKGKIKICGVFLFSSYIICGVLAIFLWCDCGVDFLIHFDLSLCGH